MIMLVDKQPPIQSHVGDSSPIRWRSCVVCNGRRTFRRWCIALCTSTQNAVRRLAYQIANQAAVHQAILFLRGFTGRRPKQAHGREAIMSLPTAEEAHTIMTTTRTPIYKVQCLSCDYNAVQDTKRDPQGHMLDICRGIHHSTYPDHQMAIMEISREELEMLILSRHPKFRKRQRMKSPLSESASNNTVKNPSAILAIMWDLGHMERGDLENLWREYGSKD
jgi:hypothetical protein